ncbi:MAG: hypothetical protein WBA74_25620, partial [Cyclobacteriaceae bacterium]
MKKISIFLLLLVSFACNDDDLSSVDKGRSEAAALPVISIYTENSSPVTSKEDYLEGTFRLEADST